MADAAPLLLCMADSSPLVSVALPVYNGEPYLAETLDDLLGQSFADLELIICDNASTDGTEALCRSAADRDPRIRYVRNERNLGALPNANLALGLARAPYVALAGHDDRHHPDFLARLVEALEADPEAVLAYPRSILIDSTGEPLVPRDNLDPTSQGALDARRRTLEYDLPRDPVARYRAVLRATDINAPTHGLFRREALGAALPYRLDGSDRYIVARTALEGRFAFIDDTLFAFRIHAQSTAALSRRAWAYRETGSADVDPRATAARAYLRYLRAPIDSELSAVSRVRGVVSAAVAPFRRAVIANLMVPGPDNYFGWGSDAPQEASVGALHEGVGESRAEQWL